MLTFFDLFLFILERFTCEWNLDFILLCLVFACINLVMKGLFF